MKRHRCDYLGLSLLLTALILTLVFLITCIRKKNLMAAIAAVAALNAAGGWWLLKRSRRKHGGYVFDFFDEDKYEVFDDDEAEHAFHAIRAGLNKKRDADETEKITKPVYEIPVDDETTEEDFAR